MHFFTILLLNNPICGISMTDFTTKMFQVTYSVIRCEAKFCKEGDEIFKCTRLKCLLETKARNMYALLNFTFNIAVQSQHKKYHLYIHEFSLISESLE